MRLLVTLQIEVPEEKPLMDFEPEDLYRLTQGAGASSIIGWEDPEWGTKHREDF